MLEDQHCVPVRNACEVVNSFVNKHLTQPANSKHALIVSMLRTEVVSSGRFQNRRTTNDAPLCCGVARHLMTEWTTPALTFGSDVKLTCLYSSMIFFPPGPSHAIVGSHIPAYFALHSHSTRSPSTRLT